MAVTYLPDRMRCEQIVWRLKRRADLGGLPAASVAGMSRRLASLRLSPFAWKTHGWTRTVPRAVLAQSPVIRNVVSTGLEPTTAAAHIAPYAGCVSAGWKEKALCNCTTPRPRYWVHWVPTARHDNRGRRWLLRVRPKSVTELGSPYSASAASTSLTPQLASVLSHPAASTSNTKVVVPSARLSSQFTPDGIQQRL